MRAKVASINLEGFIMKAALVAVAFLSVMSTAAQAVSMFSCFPIGPVVCQWSDFVTNKSGICSPHYGHPGEFCSCPAVVGSEIKDGKSRLVFGNKFGFTVCRP
jgi:hypothetical protein